MRTPTRALRKRGLLEFLTAPAFLRLHMAQGSRPFWSLRLRAKRIAFAVNRFIWKLAEFRRATGRTFSLASSIARATVAPLVASIVAVVAAHYLDRFLGRYPRAQHWLPFEPTHGEFLSVATTLAGVAGTFLGLYFTAVSVVASTSYRDVPDDVRIAALTERVGSFYLGAVAQLCSVSLLLSVYLAAGREPGRIAFALLAVSGLLGIFSFVPLGVRAFIFLNPVKLAESVGEQLVDAAAHARSKRYYRDDPSFQNAYGGRARAAMRTLDHVVQIVLRQPHNDTASIYGLARYFLGLLSHYAMTKAAIPTGSLWFARKPLFRSWLTASDTHLQMALGTGTQIPPEQLADTAWLEVRLCAATRLLLTELLEQEDYGSVDACAQAVLGDIERLTLAHRFREARILAKLIAGLAPPEGEDTALARLQRRQTLDFLRRGTIAQSIGLVRLVERDLKEEVLEWTAIVQRPDETISSPEPVREQMEFLRKSLKFEDGSGGRVSPDWYLSHVIGGAYLKYLCDSVATVVSDIRQDLVEAATRAAKGQSADVIPLIQLGLEACNKLAKHVSLVASSAERLTELRRPIGEHEWVAPAFDETLETVKAMEKELTEALAEAARQLPDEFAAEAAPDDFGYAYVILAEETLVSVLEQDDERLRTLFPAYFFVALRAYDRVLKELSDFPTKTRVAFSGDMLEDLFDLSGYALVLDDFGVPSPWTTVRGVWETYLARAKDPAVALRVFAASVDAGGKMFAVTPRDTMRTRWRRQFEHRLVELGLVEQGRYILPGEQRPRTGGPIAQEFIGSSFHKAHHAFFACFLASQPGFKDIELPSQASSFARDIERRRRDAARAGAGGRS